MSNTQYVWGAGGLVVGVLLGALIGGGPSEKDVQYAVSKAIAKSQEAAAAGDKARTEAMAAIQSQLDSLQKSVSDNSGAASDQASSMSDRLAALEKSVKDNAGAVSSDVGEKLAQLGAVVEKGLGETRDRVAALAAPKPDSGATEETGAEPSKPAAAAAAPADGLGAGETKVLADGALRVFVSRVDDGSAKLFVNGGSRTAAADESFAVETDGGSCTVKVGQIGGGKVEIGGQCGEPALPGTAPAEIKPGHATVLEDGRIKVFLSSVTPTGAARIAVNGLDTIDVDPGGRVDTNAPDGTPCHVMVDAVKDQTVSVSGTCG